jgi:plastocyanin
MRLLILFLAFFTFGNKAFCTIHTVGNNGFSYSPMNLTIQAGDTIEFQLSSTHNAVQVSEATFNANGATPLAGGFSVGFGGGQIVLTEPGTYYYVCTPHASFGMKGTITVEDESTSTFNQIANASVYLSPNPAAEFVYISFSEAIDLQYAKISIINLTGQRSGFNLSAIRRQGNEMQLDVSHLNPGIYFIEVWDQKKVFYKKLIKS